jgi:ABC-type transport system involved in cytochrome c biogenesis permease component
MTFLPIVERELRLAARRKSTHYARGAIALLAIIVSAFWLMMLQLMSPSPTGSMGATMFSLFSWYALLATLLAGLFLASDSLGGERREGTLGLLFLTDLKGYDVVLGKFAAVTLNALGGLLAVFPILALCMIVGGVSPAEFWRTCLALVNILFFSVALAMLVSAFCQSAYRSLTSSMVLLLTWLLATGIAASVTRRVFIAYASPFNAFLLARGAGSIRMTRAFWLSLAISHLFGWLFLACAAWRVRKITDEPANTLLLQRILARNPARRVATRRRKLLDVNPVLWLLDDAWQSRWLPWTLSLAGILSVSAGFRWEKAFLIGIPFFLLLKVLFAVQACRFFSEARRNGSLELLCCTPLAMRIIVKGQWAHLRRLFLWPVAAMMVAQLALSGSSLGAFLIILFVTIGNLLDFFAIGWFGMWLALSIKRPQWAAGLTLLFVVILPMTPFFCCMPLSPITSLIFSIIGYVKLSEDFRLRAPLL